jgi:hypothetical protein
MAAIRNRTCSYCGEDIRPEDSWVETSPDEIYCSMSCEAKAHGAAPCSVCGAWYGVEALHSVGNILFCKECMNDAAGE